MIVTAQQIMSTLPPEKERTYPETRRSRLLPAQPCRNAQRGCQGNTKEGQCGHGWCRRCYDRWQKHGDSWYHTPNMRRCRRPDCFMKSAEGHP